MEYKFKYKKKLWWKSFTVIGHNYIEQQDKMVLYFKDGSIRELVNWSKCEVFLGTDWVLAVKDKMEEHTNSPIAVKPR